MDNGLNPWMNWLLVEARDCVEGGAWRCVEPWMGEIEADLEPPTSDLPIGAVT
jgi:hypothetical protein